MFANQMNCAIDNYKCQNVRFCFFTFSGSLKGQEKHQETTTMNIFHACIFLKLVNKYSVISMFFYNSLPKIIRDRNFLKRVELNNGIAKRTKKLFLKTKITTTNNILPVYLNHSSLKCATEILNFSNNGNSIQNRFIELFSR